MGPVEILWRLIERIRLYHMRVLWKSYDVRTVSSPNFSKFKFLSSSDNELPQLKWDFILDSEAEASLLSGYNMALGFPWRWTSANGNWHEAPDTGKKWPKIFFGDISYRQGNPYGDARVVWEPARLQQLVALALFVQKSSGEKRKQAISLLENMLLSWCSENPSLTGIHYTSSMECALRLIAVCYAYDLARPYLNNNEVLNAIASIVISHAELIVKRLSLHSSSGNHTIAECAGLIYAGILFSEYKNAERWRLKGQELFEKEINRQILQDGSGIEQTFWYLLFITDLAGLVAELLKFRNVKNSGEINQAFLRGKKFISKFSSSPDKLPTIGDSDDGYALSEFLRLSFDDSNHINGNFMFNSSGYTLVKCELSEELSIIFNHGPLGMPPSYGHGHADALSVILRYGDDNIIIDAGTFTYTGNEQWRKYFRGTRAHNTITINGLDQAKQESLFLWSKPYDIKLENNDQLDDGTMRMLAYHDGYKHLGIRHWRGVVVLSSGYVIIWDFLSGTGKFDVELNWHLGLQFKKEGNAFLYHSSAKQVSIQVDGYGKIAICNGEANPIAGWLSPKYGVKHPIDTLRVKSYGALPMAFVTKISVDGIEADDEIINKELLLLEGRVT